MNILILTHDLKVGRPKKKLTAKVFGYYSRVQDVSAFCFASNGRRESSLLQKSQKVSYYLAKCIIGNGSFVLLFFLILPMNGKIKINFHTGHCRTGQVKKLPYFIYCIFCCSLEVFDYLNKFNQLYTPSPTPQRDTIIYYYNKMS